MTKTLKKPRVVSVKERERVECEPPSKREFVFLESYSPKEKKERRVKK